MSNDIGAKILVIEDNEINQIVLKAQVVQSGYDVATANNGKEGLERLRADLDIEIVLVDIRMPEMNGIEFVNALRLDPQLSSKYVIVVTAAIDAQDWESQLGIDANDYLAKPYDIDSLQASLKRGLAFVRSRT